jgi:hypothetical protein
MATNVIRWAPALVWAIALPVVAHSMDPNGAVSKQVSTATAHAALALGAADLKMTQVHLHHVINCLVGPAGEGYDATQDNPCKGMGQGAMVDAKGDSTRESQLQAAVTEAMHGLKAATVSEAHADAQKVLSTLQAK